MARDSQNRIPLSIEHDTRKNYQRKLNARETKLSEAILYDENIDDDFSSALIISNMDNADGTVYTGAAGEELGFHSGRAAYECHQAAVATPAVVTPFQSADGLEVKPVAAADALEITNGTTALSRAAYTIGSFDDVDKKIFFSCKVKIDDISDVTELAIGWRKAEAYQAAVDNYDEMAAFNIGQDGDGQIEIHTILNNAATAETDTTETDVADGGEHTFRIEVKNNGDCAFLFDGSTPAAVPATFSFDDGEVIIPFLFLDTETGDPGVSVSEWKVGYE